MKRLLILVIISAFAAGCVDEKAQEKALLDTVLKTHEKLMTDDGVTMKNIMALKPYADAPLTKDSAVIYIKNLSAGDDAMMSWMNKFNPDFTGKSHEQIIAYLNSQKQQVLKVDSQINSAVKLSNVYLLKVKTK